MKLSNRIENRLTSMSTAVEQQLASLQAERNYYVQRTKELASHADRSAELSGYLRLIENVNEAAIRLARLALGDGESVQAGTCH